MIGCGPRFFGRIACGPRSFGRIVILRPLVTSTQERHLLHSTQALVIHSLMPPLCQILMTWRTSLLLVALRSCWRFRTRRGWGSTGLQAGTVVRGKVAASLAGLEGVEDFSRQALADGSEIARRTLFGEISDACSWGRVGSWPLEPPRTHKHFRS